MRTGFITTEAASGKQAVSLCASNMYDLIFLDILMPDIDGYKTAEQIKQNPDFDKIPIIAMSAIIDVNNETRNKCLKAGCVDLIPKPFYDYEISDKLIKYLPVKPVFLKSQETDKISLNLPNNEDMLQIIQLSQEGDISTLSKHLKSIKSKYKDY